MALESLDETGAPTIGDEVPVSVEVQGLEQYRHTLQGVHVVTFDELVEKLKALHALLAGD